MTNFIKTAYINRHSNPLELFPIILLVASGLTILSALGLWAYQHFYSAEQMSSGQMLRPYSTVELKSNPCLKILAKEGIEKSYRYCHAYAETGDIDAELIVGIQTYFGLGTQSNQEGAMQWFQKAAKLQHPQAQHLLSLGYEHGVGLKKDTNKALYWATKAAEYPYKIFTYHLGHLQKTKDPKKAQENLLKAAMQNYAPSQYELGLLYLKGGVKQDAHQAFYWVQKAAENKYVPAYLELGKFYQRGQGTVVDAELAFQYYAKAAGENIPEAQYQLGMYLLNEHSFEHEPQQGLNWLIRAAKNNYTPAKSKIGEIYFEGSFVEKDIEQALAWWVSAAQDKDYQASFHLGKILEQGYGVPKDLSAAIHWYLKSAEGNYSKAQLKLAEFYYHGMGVVQDPIKSFVLYSQAASQGETEASLPLAYLYDKGFGTIQDKQKALYWYQRAAQQENPNAWRALGLAYLNSGDQTQISLGKMWLNKADSLDKIVASEFVETHANIATPLVAQKLLDEPSLSEGGDPKILFQLGRAMLNGNDILNISANPQEGLLYIEQSAKEGLELAALYLGRIYVTGEEPNVSPNYGKALNWLDKPARKGHSEAQFYLGQMFYQGLGVSKNNVKAYAWLNLAASQGNSQAGLIRNQLAIELAPAELEQAQKLSLEYMS